MKSKNKFTSEVASQVVSSIDVQLLVRLFDQASDIAFFVKDSQGRYLAVNESLLKRHGLKCKADVIGKRPIEICTGDLGKLPTDQDARVLRTGRPLIDHLEMQLHHPFEPVWCLTTKLPILDLGGKVSGLIGFSRDLRAHVKSTEMPASLAREIEKLEQNPSDIGTPHMLAQQSNMTLKRLARLTTRLFGLTPSQFINKNRVAFATRLLRESQDSIGDIALACGFYDQSAFTRSFRLATGVTPSQYRKHF